MIFKQFSICLFAFGIYVGNAVDSCAQNILDNGKSSFGISHSISSCPLRIECDFDNRPDFQNRSQLTLFDLRSDINLILAAESEFARSRNALRILAKHGSFELPVSCEFPSSNVLLARWQGDLGILSKTTFSPRHDLVNLDRPTIDHIELVWTSAGFKINRYQDMDNRVRKCTPLPPAVLTETIPLIVHSDGSPLVLRPKFQRSVLPMIFVVSIAETDLTTKSLDDFCITTEEQRMQLKIARREKCVDLIAFNSLLVTGFFNPQRQWLTHTCNRTSPWTSKIIGGR